MRVEHVTAWTAAALIVMGGAVACGNDSYCGDGTTVCDEQGNPLVYAPYLIPAFGIYGQPGYRAPVTIYPGAPNYHVTYVNHPPTYSPPVAPKPPPANPSNAKPTAPVSAPAPSGYKPPKVSSGGGGVNAPSVKVNAPSVKVNAPAPAPAPKPASPPVKSGR